MTQYRVVMADGSVFSSGSIAAAGADVSVPVSGAEAGPGFTIQAWIDANHNGVVDGIESVTSLMAVSTKFSVRPHDSKTIFTGGGTTEVRMSITITEGNGTITVTRINADGQEESAPITYGMGGPNQPFGTILQGKITKVVVTADASTVGTITQE
jgi:hypothetical protein